MYKGYPICLEEEGTVSVLRLKLEPLEEIRLHEEVIPDAFRKICRAICEEGVLQDPIFVDEDTKVILDGMHRAAALLKLKYGECKALFLDEKTQTYSYPECEKCTGKFKQLEYVLCCTLDYANSKAVELRKWYRGVKYPLAHLLEAIPSVYLVEEREKENAELDDQCFAVVTDGKKYFSLSGEFKTVLDKYLALRKIEQIIREKGGEIIYCADEEAFDLLKEGKFSFLMITPTITRKDVQTFSKPGFPCKGEVFPPKSTRHRLSARPLKINIPLRLLEKGKYSFKQEQLKVFLRRKRKLTVTGRLEQYLEKHKILFGEPGELKKPLDNPYLWVCEFPLEFYEIKYKVDEFVEEVALSLIQKEMELAYSALIRETNRLVFIISDVKDVNLTEKTINSLLQTHFPHYRVRNLFGLREDKTPAWMVPMEDYTPSRAYFARNERLLRRLVRTHKALQEGSTFGEAVEKGDPEKVLEYSAHDLLILFAFHVLKKAARCKVFEYLHEDIRDHAEVFARIEALTAEGLLKNTDEESRRNEISLTEEGKEVITNALSITREITELFRELSIDKFSSVLEKIDSNVANVIKPDGRKDEFHIGSIMESLVFTDIGWRKVADILDRVAEEFRHIDFASSDELTSFVQDYLEKEYPLTNIAFRYDYFINSRNYIFLKDENVVTLSRKDIEDDLDRFIPDYLEMTASQKSRLSNMVYEGIRLLTVPLIKELYEKERIVIEREFFSQIEEFLVFQAVPVLSQLQKKSCKKIIEESLDRAKSNAELCAELIHRNDAGFLKFYLLTMDSLTESLSLAVSQVPLFDVFGRLSQLALLARDSRTELVYLFPQDPPRFLRFVTNVLRRSTSLLDQWRSLYHTYHEESFLCEHGVSWEKHISDAKVLIDRCSRIVGEKG